MSDWHAYSFVKGVAESGCCLRVIVDVEQAEMDLAGHDVAVIRPRQWQSGTRRGLTGIVRAGLKPTLLLFSSIFAISYPLVASFSHLPGR